VTRTSSQQRHGPVPATHTGICPRCNTRQRVRPATGTMIQHGHHRLDGGHRVTGGCPGYRDEPLAGTVEPVSAMLRQDEPVPVSSPTTPTYSTVEAMNLLDVTYRQLHYWVTKGWIPGLSPMGSGNSPDRVWRWTLEQVGVARRIRDHLNQVRTLRADPTRCHGCPCGDEGV
jgi:hypothetical protein